MVTRGLEEGFRGATFQTCQTCQVTCQKFLLEADIEVETTFFSVKLTAKCMEDPLYGLVIGYVGGTSISGAWVEMAFRPHTTKEQSHLRKEDKERLKEDDMAKSFEEQPTIQMENCFDVTRMDFIAQPRPLARISTTRKHFFGVHKLPSRKRLNQLILPKPHPEKPNRFGRESLWRAAKVPKRPNSELGPNNID